MLRPQWRILSLYLVVGCLWIFFSDLLVAQWGRDPVWILRVQSIKGWLFILITSALLFVMIRRDHHRLLAANQALVASYDQTIRGWVRVMDLRHRETRDHTRRVTLAQGPTDQALPCGWRQPASECLHGEQLIHEPSRLSR